MLESLLRDEILDRRQSLPFTGFNEATSSIHDLHIQSANGHLESIFALSELYGVGKEVPQDQNFAFRLLRYAAEQGFQPAFAAVGFCYAYGLGTQQNHIESARWFLQTDYRNDANILAFLAYCFHNGIGVPQDITKVFDLGIDAAELGHCDAFRFCKTAADANYARGQFALGHIYQYGIGVPPNLQVAIQLFHQAANQNYAPAQCRLGIIYLEGTSGIEKDPAVAVQWFQLAAAQNDPIARHLLACCLVKGEGIEQNKEEAAQIWRELVQENNPSAQYNLGALLTDKDFTGYNPKAGIKLLRQSAKQHFILAQTTLGTFYYEGVENIVKQNPREARRWFRKAAKRGDRVAQYYLGELYFDGSGVAVNQKKAAKWYEQSSNAGYIPAMQKFAHCLLHGIGTKQNEDNGYLLLMLLALGNDEEALSLLQSAAASNNPAAEFGMAVYSREKGNIDTAYDWLVRSANRGNANALRSLAFRYEDEKDYEQSLRYFRLAAEKGDAEAQFRLALVLEDFTDRKAPSNKDAFKWMKSASKQGHSSANYNLGNFYLDGTGVDVDVLKAVECYKLAAAKENSDGMDRLGDCFAFGIGVELNPSVAFWYFYHAAVMGNPKGQCHLGLCYLYGAGCYPDTELAFQWITLAVESGHPIVIQTLRFAGLDFERLCKGYKSFQIQLSAWENRYGESFDRAFDSPVEKSLLPIPPSERVVES